MTINKIKSYIRVSGQKLKTDGDRRQDVNRQKEKITKFSENMGWGIPEFYCDDGISAYKDDYNSRPEFLKLLREVKANRVERIIIEDLTRWSRRIEDGLRTLREVTEKCKVTSMHEGEIEITIPEDWFKTAIGLLMAEWQSKVQSHKVSEAMDRRLQNPKAICESCKVVHLGRHPNSCGCVSCVQRKGRAKRREDYKENKLTK